MAGGRGGDSAGAQMSAFVFWGKSFYMKGNETAGRQGVKGKRRSVGCCCNINNSYLLYNLYVLLIAGFASNIANVNKGKIAVSLGGNG